MNEKQEKQEDSRGWYCIKGFTAPKDWDWKLIRKEWNRLKMPKDVAYDIFHIPWQRTAYTMLISKRGVGKTTSVMLLGLILFKLYGVQIQYIRQTDDMTTPSIEELYAQVAHLRNTSTEELLRAIAQNYNRLIFKG
jgi:hypothetical protein